MNIINTLTWRSLKLNRKRTIVTIIGIILSGAMICGTFTLAASFQDVFVQGVIKTDGNFHAAFFNVGPEQIKYLTDNAYTKKAMLSRDLGYARFERSTSEYKPYFFVREYDDTAFRQMPVELTAGRFPEKAGEILISEEILKHGGESYQIGDAISFAVGERINEGQQMPFDSSLEETEQFKATAAKKTYTVTGLMAKPFYETIGGIPGFTVIAYLDQRDLAAKPVTVSIQGKNPRQIYDKVPQMAKNAGIEHYDYNDRLLNRMGISKKDNVMAMFYSVVAIILGLIAAGSVIVIYNAFAISVSERKRQFGMLAGIGAAPGQIRRSVFFEGALLALGGIPLGILSGIGGIAVTLSVVNRLLSGMVYNEDTALRLIVSPGVILGSIAFMAMLIFISAYIPAKRASAASPIEAIRLSSDIKIQGKAVKTSRLTRFLWGFEGELALKNLKRNRRRYRTTVLSLFISIVLFVSCSSFLNYGFSSSDLYFQDTPFDLAVTLYNASPEEQAEFYERITALDGVERYAISRMTFADCWLTRSRFGSYLQEKHLDDQNSFPVNKKNQYSCAVRINALGEAEFKAYAAENGIDAAAFQDTQNLKGILINKNILQGAAKRTEYEPLQAKTGEKLLLTTSSGVPAPPAHVPFSMEIGAITDTLPMGVAYTGPAEINIIVSDKAFPVFRSQLTDESLPASGNEAELYICADNSAALGDMSEQIRANFEDYSDHCFLNINDVQADRHDAERSRTLVSIFLYGFITLITLIGVTNIFNTISTNIALRRREFAMLQSVGLTPRGFNKMINYESIFYGLKALLYGLPVGILISMLLHSSFSDVFEFAFFLPGKEILACIIGVFVIVFITMLHAGAKLKNDNIIEALRAENL